MLGVQRPTGGRHWRRALEFPQIDIRMFPVALVIQGMLVHVNALVLPLGVTFQFANSSPEPRQIYFLARHFEEFLGMRVVEHPYPIRHDPYSQFQLMIDVVLRAHSRRQLFAKVAIAASRVIARAAGRDQVSNLSAKNVRVAVLRASD